jgi:hypothetical protein
VGENSGQLFFIMGVFLLVLSLLLIFVLHIHTQIIDGKLILDGLWTSRNVQIDLNNISMARKVKYSKYYLNPPVYNLHYKKRVRFFTQGNDAIELKTRDGVKYRIGSQKADDFLKALSIAAPHIKSKKELVNL